MTEEQKLALFDESGWGILATINKKHLRKHLRKHLKKHLKKHGFVSVEQCKDWLRAW